MMTRTLLSLLLAGACLVAASCGSPPSPADVATRVATPTADVPPADANGSIDVAPEAALTPDTDTRIADASLADVTGDAPAETADGTSGDTTAFAPLRALPLTLHYVVNGTAVACQLADAGVPDSDRDFKVACTPDVPWRCVATSAFADAPTRAAPDFWRSEGCYAAHPDGLYYFATCPGGADAKAAFDDPAKAKGVRMLSAHMLEPRVADPNDAPDPTKTTTFRTFRITAPGADSSAPTELATTCNDVADSAMMKTLKTSTCMSPQYGYVASESGLEQMLEPICHDWSALVAVEAGLRPPRTCATEADFSGTWRFETRVVVAKNEKALGTFGRYRLTVSAPPADAKAGQCAIPVHLEKLGINKQDFDAQRVQLADAVAWPALCPPGFGRGCYQIAARVADAKKVGIDVRFVVAVEGDALHGLWQYEKGSWQTAGLAGTLFGVRGDEAPAAVARPTVTELVRCTLRSCHFNEAGGRATPLECQPEARASCMTDTP